MFTAQLRTQHQEIGAKIGELRRALSGGKASAPALRALLVELSGKVMLHLGTEDRMLYPRMAAAKDPAAAAMAKQFMDEMGGLAGAFKAFTSHWPSGDTIANAFPAFSKECSGVIDALVKRVGREEAELYPKADSLPG